MRITHLALSLVVAFPTGRLTAADPEPAPVYTPLTPVPRRLNDFVRMSRCELEALFRQAEIGTPPAGVTRGRAIFNPGSSMTVPAARATRVLWQGKVFTSDGMMVNRVFGLRAVHARVYLGESWLDGQPAIILDYAGTSRLFPNVRDEMREVTPGVYLGLTYLRRDEGPKQAMFFALDARPKAR